MKCSITDMRAEVQDDPRFSSKGRPVNIYICRQTKGITLHDLSCILICEELLLIVKVTP